MNSVNGEPEVLERMLPIVKKYGASVVGLTLDKNGIPKQRKSGSPSPAAFCRPLCTTASPERMWIDCLTLTVSAQQEQAAETLKAVRTIREDPGAAGGAGRVQHLLLACPTAALITQNFLIQAMHAG